MDITHLLEQLDELTTALNRGDTITCAQRIWAPREDYPCKLSIERVGKGKFGMRFNGWSFICMDYEDIPK